MCKPYARQFYKFARYDKKIRKKVNKLSIYISGYGLGSLTLRACILIGHRTTQFTRFKLHLLPNITLEPLHLDPRCNPIITNVSTPAVGNNQFHFKYSATQKHQHGNTFSRFTVTEKGESRTVFNRETEFIHIIQLRNVPVATATKNHIVLSHVVELTKNWLPSS